MYYQEGIHYGPVMCFLKICNEYNVLNIVKSAVEDCKYPRKAEWKKVVGSRVCYVV